MRSLAVPIANAGSVFIDCSIRLICSAKYSALQTNSLRVFRLTWPDNKRSEIALHRSIKSFSLSNLYSETY